MRSAKQPRLPEPEESGDWQDELQCPGIVLSCVASISRNIAGKAFPDILDAEARRTLRDDLFARIREHRPREWDMVSFDDEDARDDAVAEGLCTPAFAAVEGGGIAVCRRPSPKRSAPAASVTLLVNEDDHLRFRAKTFGCDVRRMYDLASGCESAFDGTVVEYAFDPSFGYLTADPAHLGTGLHVGMTLHLAGLRLVGDLDKVFRATERLGLVARNAVDDPAFPTPTIFEFFNAQTLGEDEQGILERTDAILHDLAVQEDWARQRLLDAGSDVLSDFMGRVYGIAMHARCLSEAEANELNRAFVMGVEMGLLDVRRRANPVVLPWIHPVDAGHPGAHSADDLARGRADLIRELYESVRLR